MRIDSEVVQVGIEYRSIEEHFLAPGVNGDVTH